MTEDCYARGYRRRLWLEEMDRRFAAPVWEIYEHPVVELLEHLHADYPETAFRLQWDDRQN